jgi:hypothetical protein
MTLPARREFIEVRHFVHPGPPSYPRFPDCEMQRTVELRITIVRRRRPRRKERIVTLYTLDAKNPGLGSDCFVAPSADVIGNVTLKSGASVWFNAVIRGDNEEIIIG